MWSNRHKTCGTEPHFHADENGVLVKCYHACRTALNDSKFWIGLTIGWPIEHFLYSHVWPFNLVAGLIGVG